MHPFSPFSPTCRVFMYCAPYQVNKNNDYNDMQGLNLSSEEKRIEDDGKP